MENFIIYLAKASILIAVFITAYHLFLKRETFFNANRWFLLAGLFTSVLLPLAVYTKIVMIDPAPAQEIQAQSLHQLVVLRQVQSVSNPQYTINWFDVVAGMYITGVLFFFVRFLLDIRAIKRLIKGQLAIREGSYLMVDSATVRSPFSFFNYIVYNSAALQPDELTSIISHEKVHSRQKHSLDMTIGQLFCTFFWFNPLVWLYKRSISQNLEFIADAEATRMLSDKRAYQKTLLKITVQPECIAITNHFYQSLIKKRIVMLNKKQSKRRNSWKYALVLPVLVAFMLLFQVRTVAQEKAGADKGKATQTKITMEINKDSKDEELETEKKIFKDEFNTDVNFQNIARNQKNEITAIKVTVKDNGQSQVYEVAGTTPITPFTVEVEKDGSGRNAISFGRGDRKRNFIARGDNFAILDGDALLNRDHDSLMKNHRRIMKINERMLPPAPMAPGEPPFPGSWSVNKIRMGDKDMLIIINGVKQKKGDNVIKLPLDQEIDELNVLEPKEAKKKYGRDGKKGVIEITTKRGGNGVRMMQMMPQGFEFEMPDMPHGEAFNFQFDIPGFSGLEGVESIENFEKAFKDFRFEDFEQLGDAFSPEDMEKLQKDLNSAQAEIQRMMPELSGKLRQSMTDEEYKAAKKEIEDAKKEIEEAKKEIQEARKEIAKSRAGLNKKA